MLLHHIIILALVQGITEFLPISSSGHLVLGHAIIDGNIGEANWDNQDLLIDVAVHLGTLLSVCLYFYKDIFGMVLGGCSLLTGKVTHNTKLALYVVLSSIPVIIAGLAIHAIKPDFLRSVEVMAWATIVFGVVLWAADRFFKDGKTLADMSWKGAIIIGLAQTLALIPGTSRSGITMTAARMTGYSRTEAARYSLLLAIVAILGAGTLATKDLIEAGDVTLTINALIAAGVSFIAGWISIALMMRWLAKSTFTPFAIYRVILGGALLAYLYGVA